MQFEELATLTLKVAKLLVGVSVAISAVVKLEKVTVLLLSLESAPRAEVSEKVQ